MVPLTNTRTRVVLVVEDDKPIGELLVGVISDEEGYRAIHMTRPTDALHAMERFRGRTAPSSASVGSEGSCRSPSTWVSSSRT